jgi:hypothetical protein
MVEIRVRGSSQVQVREGDTLTISDYKEGCSARETRREMIVERMRLSKS